MDIRRCLKTLEDIRVFPCILVHMIVNLTATVIQNIRDDTRDLCKYHSSTDMIPFGRKLPRRLV